MAVKHENKQELDTCISYPMPVYYQASNVFFFARLAAQCGPLLGHCARQKFVVAFQLYYEWTKKNARETIRMTLSVRLCRILHQLHQKSYLSPSQDLKSGIVTSTHLSVQPKYHNVFIICYTINMFFINSLLIPHNLPYMLHSDS
jgi:hypothetical protein